MAMAKMSRKEVEKFMKDNPDSHAAQAIKEQLREDRDPEPQTWDQTQLSVSRGQIRNTVADLAAKKINGLHREILDGFRDVFTKVITIGEILVQQKETLKHGAWFDWIDEQLAIGPRQVQNYMRIYDQREAVLASMGDLAETGLKPSFRKMLHAAVGKDRQTVEEYRKSRKKTDPALTPQERRKHCKDAKRDNEIVTLAKMHMDKVIDDGALRALVMKWNMDNSDNSQLFIEDVKNNSRRIDQELHPDIFNPNPSVKTNVMLSVNADLWDAFVRFGGREVFLTEYVTNYLTEYVIEQQSYGIAN